MRDTFRVGSERFAANFNRISSNITDKILHFQQENPEISSREISTVSNNSILQSVALRAIPCVDIQAGNGSSAQNGSGPPHYSHRGPPTNPSDHDLDNISDLSIPARPPTACS